MPDSKRKKKPYSAPAVNELTEEQGRLFVVDRARCSHQEAADFLESLGREQRRNEQRENDANDKKRKRSA
jgi:hypothetical protein